MASQTHFIELSAIEIDMVKSRAALCLIQLQTGRLPFESNEAAGFSAPPSGFVLSVDRPSLSNEGQMQDTAPVSGPLTAVSNNRSAPTPILHQKTSSLSGSGDRSMVNHRSRSTNEQKELDLEDARIRLKRQMQQEMGPPSRKRARSPDQVEARTDEKRTRLQERGTLPQELQSEPTRRRSRQQSFMPEQGQRRTTDPSARPPHGLRRFDRSQTVYSAGNFQPSGMAVPQSTPGQFESTFQEYGRYCPTSSVPPSRSQSSVLPNANMSAQPSNSRPRKTVKPKKSVPASNYNAFMTLDFSSGTPDRSTEHGSASDPHVKCPRCHMSSVSRDGLKVLFRCGHTFSVPLPP